jgi:hypothetical protein
VTVQSQQYKGQRVTPQQPASGSTGASRSLPRAPKRYGQWVGTVLFVVVVALAAAYLYMAKGETTEVLVLDRAVAAGQEIKEEDLGSAQVSGVADAVPVADLGEVLGTRASIGLVPGQVLTNGALTSEPVPGPKERMVAVRLEAGRVPATLKSGTVVNVLSVPPTGDAGDPEGLDDPQTLSEDAEVYAVKTAVDGSVVVSLLVTEVDADKLAAYSAAGRVTVVQASVTGE